FQQMINRLSDVDLSLDGDLLAYNKEGDILSQITTTENALMQLFLQENILLDAKDIRRDLKKEKQQKFEQTDTYLQVTRLYQEKFKKDAPYAIMPEVVISGPKLSRDYNTNWY